MSSVEKPVDRLTCRKNQRIKQFSGNVRQLQYFRIGILEQNTGL